MVAERASVLSRKRQTGLVDGNRAMVISLVVPCRLVGNEEFHNLLSAGLDISSLLP